MPRLELFQSRAGGAFEMRPAGPLVTEANLPEAGSARPVASELYREFTERIESCLHGLTCSFAALYGPGVEHDEFAVVTLLSRADGVLQAWETLGGLLVGVDDELFVSDRSRLHRLYGVEVS